MSQHKRGNFLLRFSTQPRSPRSGVELTEGMEKVWHTERQVSQLFSYRFTFVITRRVAARRMSKINGSHLELFPRTFFSLAPLFSLFLSLPPSSRYTPPPFIPPGFIINVNVPPVGRQSRGADANFYQIIRTRCAFSLNAPPL